MFTSCSPVWPGGLCFDPRCSIYFADINSALFQSLKAQGKAREERLLVTKQAKPDRRKGKKDKDDEDNP